MAMKKKSQIKFGVPQAIVASVAVASFAAVYVFAPEDSRDAIERGVLAVWALVSTFVGPMVRREIVGGDEGGAS
jgi:hypothetical protein